MAGNVPPERACVALLHITCTSRLLQVLFVVMIEAGACLMLGAAVSYGQSPHVATGGDTPRLDTTDHDVARPLQITEGGGRVGEGTRPLDIKTVEIFLMQACTRVDDDEAIVEEGELHRRFLAWCVQLGEGSVGSGEFSACLAEVCRSWSISRRRDGTNVYVLGVGIRGGGDV